jgi:hypothetical protein
MSNLTKNRECYKKKKTFLNIKTQATIKQEKRLKYFGVCL